MKILKENWIVYAFGLFVSLVVPFPAVLHWNPFQHGASFRVIWFSWFFFAMVCSAANIIIWNHHNWPLNEAYAFVYARPQANISHLHCSELKSLYFFTFASFSILKASRFWLPPVPLPEQVYYWNSRIFYLLAISGTEIQHILKKKKYAENFSCSTLFGILIHS